MEINKQMSDDQEPHIIEGETNTAEVGGLEQFDIETINKLHQTSIAGFWRRLLAFIIDSAIVAIPLIILGFAFRDFAFSLGPWGRMIGYVFIISYWGYFNSTKRSGQTIGKQITRIAVVDHNNLYLSIGKSFFRALILGSIFMLNGWALPILQYPIIAILSAIIVFGGSLAMIYGLVFNRTTRQGIHDLSVGSYVVNAPPDLKLVTPQIPRVHQRITYSLLGVGLLLGIMGLFVQLSRPNLGIVNTGEWEEMQKLQSSIIDRGEFFSVSVNRVNRSQFGSSTVLKDLNIEVWAKTSCGRKPDYCDELIKEVAVTAFNEYSNIENLSGMRIAIVNRFDFGLSSGHLTRSTAWSMEDWEKELEN